MSSPSSPSVLTKNNFQRNDSSWLVELNDFLTVLERDKTLEKNVIGASAGVLRYYQ